MDSFVDNRSRDILMGELKGKKLGDIFVALGYMTQENLDEVLRDSRNRRIGEVCIERGYINEEQLIEAIVHQGFTRWDDNIDKFEVELIKKFDYSEMNNKYYIPISIDNGVASIVVYDAIDHTIDAIIKDKVNCLKVEKYITTKSKITSVLQEYYKHNRDKLFKSMRKNIKFTNNETYLQDLLKWAIEEQSSDIHLDFASNGSLEVRVRTMGLLKLVSEIDNGVANQFIRALKVKANITPEEKGGKDGSFSVKMRDRKEDINVRASFVPTIAFPESQKVVLRIMGSSKDLMTLGELGYLEEDVNKIRRYARKGSGMCLVTGTTGSGKTMTSYATLQYINNGQKNIVTLEDPVEIQLDGLNQYKVNKHMTISDSLRLIMRQDPNIIYVGEIRDEDTAKIAIQSSITGHLMYSTMHTKDCISTIARFNELGIENNLIAEVLNYVIYQKLVRTLCQKCKIEMKSGQIYELSRENETFKGKHLYTNGQGCPDCKDGFTGRTVIYEMLEVTDDTYENILNFNKVNLKKSIVTTMEEVALFKLDYINFEDLEFLL